MAGVRGFLIDSKKREIRPMVFKGYSDIQRAVGGSITVAHNIYGASDDLSELTEQQLSEPHDTVYIDDEGLLKNPKHFFTIVGADQPFAGNGVIIGTDEEGGAIDSLMDLEMVREVVEFADAEEAISISEKSDDWDYDADSYEKFAELHGPDEDPISLHDLTAVIIQTWHKYRSETSKGSRSDAFSVDPMRLPNAGIAIRVRGDTVPGFVSKVSVTAVQPSGTIDAPKFMAYLVKHIQQEFVREALSVGFAGDYTLDSKSSVQIAPIYKNGFRIVDDYSDGSLKDRANTDYIISVRASQ